MDMTNDSVAEMQFKPVELEDRDTLLPYIERAAVPICDLAFSNLYSWGFVYNTSWAIVEDSLVIRFRALEKAHDFFLFPVGPNPENMLAAARALKQRSVMGESPLTFMGITKELRELIETRCTSEYHFINDAAYCDYIYNRSDLAELKGKKYQPKRNHINKFERLYPNWEYREISDDYVDQCLALAGNWLDDNGADESRQQENLMLQRAIKNRVALGLSTGMILVDEKVVAFSLGSPINVDTFGVHVEKADINYEGSFTLINREFAKRVPESYAYINREEDLGLDGLRKAKLSYHPSIQLCKETAILRRLEKEE